MSEESKAPFNKLTDKTWVPLGKVIIICGALFSGCWMLSSAVRDLQATVEDLRRDRWTATDMERWTVLLERANRSQVSLIVPDVREVQSVTRRLRETNP
jgi:hypothetical protein